MIDFLQMRLSPLLLVRKDVKRLMYINAICIRSCDYLCTTAHRFEAITQFFLNTTIVGHDLIK